MRLTKADLRSLRSTFGRAQRRLGTAYHVEFFGGADDAPDTVYTVDRHPSRGVEDANSFEVTVCEGWRHCTRHMRYVLAGHEVLHMMVWPISDLIPKSKQVLAIKTEENVVYALQRAIFGDTRKEKP